VPVLTPVLRCAIGGGLLGLLSGSRLAGGCAFTASLASLAVVPSRRGLGPADLVAAQRSGAGGSSARAVRPGWARLRRRWSGATPRRRGAVAWARLRPGGRVVRRRTAWACTSSAGAELYETGRLAPPWASRVPTPPEGDGPRRLVPTPGGRPRPVGTHHRRRPQLPSWPFVAQLAVVKSARLTALSPVASRAWNFAVAVAPGWRRRREGGSRHRSCCRRRRTASPRRLRPVRRRAAAPGRLSSTRGDVDALHE
jgi:hypothetical protein